MSGPLPQLDNADGDAARDRLSPIKTMRFPWSSPSAPTSPIVNPVSSSPPLPARAASHRRTFSGNILAKFHLSKGASDSHESLGPAHEDRPEEAQTLGNFVSRKSIDDDASSPFTHLKSDSGASGALRGKTRKRKGSLRKTALLGGRKFGSDRERKSSLLQHNTPAHPATENDPAQPEDEELLETPKVSDQRSIGTSHMNEDSGIVRHQFSYESATAMSSSDSGWSQLKPGSTERLSLVTEQQSSNRAAFNKLGSPLDMKSPISHSSYASASTTDDDEMLTFHRPAKGYVDSDREVLSLQQPLSAAATSYFPPVASLSDASLTRRRSSKKSRSSPLSHNMTTLAAFPEPEPHDYTETEYWGWVILFVTWLTFTVGMGSCLEIWSWAWDVGETPYAPPELEDDPTLPIVGYYPALIVLTGVVAWIWITVAWVGMKYFRHAKIDV